MKKGMGLARVDLGFNRGIRPARVGWGHEGDETSAGGLGLEPTGGPVPSAPAPGLLHRRGCVVSPFFFSEKNLGSFSDRAVLRGFCRLDP